jgi:tetratricopeptide (TPR) repeat protein
MRWLSVLAAGPAPLIGTDEASGGVPRSAAAQPHYRVSIALLRARDRVRFAAELHEGETGRILWSQHYDRALGGDVFGMVDDLAAALASRLDREVELAEIIRASRKPVEALSAYDCVLRAIPLIFKLTPESFAEAERLLVTAQRADPHDPLVYAWRAFWYFLDIGQGWARDIETAKAELGWLVRRAIELDPKSALALAVAGHIASFVNHDYDRALGLFEQSLKLDPNSAYAWDLSALTLCYSGNAEEGLRRLEGSSELWRGHPNPYYFRTSACIALMLAGEYDRAIELGRKTVRESPSFHAPYRPLIASLGHTGRIDEAREYLAGLRQLEPDFSIGWFRANYPPLHEDYSDRYIEGFRKAGVPKE